MVYARKCACGSKSNTGKEIGGEEAPILISLSAADQSRINLQVETTNRLLLTH